MKKPRMTILLVLALACVAPVVPTFAADETPDYIMDVMAHKKTYQRPSFFYEKASNFGDNRASEELSNAYLEGKLGLEEDIQKAFFYLEKAGNQGNEKALKDLVEIYSEGVEKDEIKIPADPVKMEEWKKKAEEIKNPISHYFFIFNLRQLQN